MKTKDFNKKIDLVAARAKALNIKASDQLHLAVARAGLQLQKTAQKLADSAEELAVKAHHLARQASPKPVRKSVR
ncbi:MAG TPA: hypothetical protein VLT82_03545 [Myxococcaceae bacterium]|nr:hypothetical protein [Myxococcaceae bacterium]